MSIEKSQITVSGVAVQVVRKAIKNLHLGVYPPRGRVRVAAPLRVGDNAVRLAVIGRLGWIKRQQANFEAQPRQSEREMISGETHYFLGQRFRLRVICRDGPGQIIIRRRAIIELHARQETDARQRERILQQWYRRQLRGLVPPLLEKWQAALGIQVTGWGIKKMKTKWGSCNIDARRVWLNLELAKKPVACLEYIVVHEMVHLLERCHSDRFTELMNTFLPKWRLYREELNRAPLRHETWMY